MGLIKNGFFGLLLFPILLGGQLFAEDDVWPKEVQVEKYKLVIYQPQPESLEGNTLKALAAFSIESNKTKEPIFGAIWFQAKVDVDKSKNRAELNELSLDRLSFPD